MVFNVTHFTSTAITEYYQAPEKNLKSDKSCEFDTFNRKESNSILELLLKEAVKASKFIEKCEKQNFSEKIELEEFTSSMLEHM